MILDGASIVIKNEVDAGVALYEMKLYRYGEVFYGYKLKYYISIDSNVKKNKGQRK